MFGIYLHRYFLCFGDCSIVGVVVYFEILSVFFCCFQSALFGYVCYVFHLLCKCVDGLKTLKWWFISVFCILDVFNQHFFLFEWRFIEFFQIYIDYFVFRNLWGNKQWLDCDWRLWVMGGGDLSSVHWYCRFMWVRP